MTDDDVGTGGQTCGLPSRYAHALDYIHEMQHDRLRENEWKDPLAHWGDGPRRAVRAIVDYERAMEDGRFDEAHRHAADAANLLVISLQDVATTYGLPLVRGRLDRG